MRPVPRLDAISIPQMYFFDVLSFSRLIGVVSRWWSLLPAFRFRCSNFIYYFMMFVCQVLLRSAMSLLLISPLSTVPILQHLNLSWLSATFWNRFGSQPNSLIACGRAGPLNVTPDCASTSTWNDATNQESHQASWTCCIKRFTNLTPSARQASCPIAHPMQCQTQESLADYLNIIEYPLKLCHFQETAFAARS